LRGIIHAHSFYSHDACDGEGFVVLSVLDNLVKGAAGGAVQWMNRLLGFPEDAGLRLPGPAWI
jgi:N-acetyl-gamma-glutamylphosphate reductase